MGEKSERKRQYIVERARGVFAQKGYKAVTMKDIVEACEISRGGLYLYFNSTKEVFEAVLRADDKGEDDEDDAIYGEITGDTSASDMLAIFIKTQKREVFRKRGNLTVATYEYFAESAKQPLSSALKERFDTAVMVLERIILSGTESGEFYCEDPAGCARNMMYVIEGMKFAVHTTGATEAMFDREMLYVLGNLVLQDEEDAEPEAQEDNVTEDAHV